MKRILVLTDIWNRPTDRECFLNKCVSAEFDRVSISELLGIPELAGELVHSMLFGNGKADDVVSQLAAYQDKYDFAVGFSAGGTLLWRAVENGLKLKGLVCISSTRLRDESSLSIHTQATFGSLDINRPNDEWIRTIPTEGHVLEECAHDFYLNPDTTNARQISDLIAQDIAALGDE